MGAVVMGLAEAETRLSRLNKTMEAAWDDITALYRGQAWICLGLGSWEALCDERLGTRIALPRDERRQVVEQLSSEGLSQRAIGQAIGVTEATVNRDLSGVTNVTPEDPAPVAPVIGLDGKRYTPRGRQTDVIKNPRQSEIDELADRLLAGESIVVNLHDSVLTDALRARDLLVRIDRRSIWGNPWIVDDDGDRDTVIKHYRELYLPTKPSLLDNLDELRGKALACWCAPLPCHGDVLVKALES